MLCREWGVLMDCGEFVNLSEASRELGVSRETVATMIRRGQLEDFTSQINRRVRLLRAEDIKKLKEGAIVRRPSETRPQGAAA